MAACIADAFEKELDLLKQSVAGQQDRARAASSAKVRRLSSVDAQFLAIEQGRNLQAPRNPGQALDKASARRLVGADGIEPPTAGV